MADVFATSFGVLNYSGMLFNKGNVKTPLSSIIGSKAKTTNHVEFVTGQEYSSGGNGSQPKITENQSLTAPDASVTTREQKTTDDMSCPIDENTVLFVDSKPGYRQGKPAFDYTVKRVAKSLNTISYAVSKVKVS